MKNKHRIARIVLPYVLLAQAFCSFSQNNRPSPVIDPLSFGVVLDHPGIKNVNVKKDVTYLLDDKGSLKIDIYSPPGIKNDDRLPAIIFLNAIGETPNVRKVKDWGIYSSWPKLMAAYGYIGISMETDGTRIGESIQGLFDFINRNGGQYNIDTGRVGVYAASANVTESVRYLMNDKAYKGIKAAVLYYGGAPEGPFRKDLPVLFVIAEGDVRPGSYSNLLNEVLKNNAPWTIKMGTAMPHAFDAYADNEAARKIIKETIAFWQDQLGVIPAPSWPHSKVRDMLAFLRTDFPKALQILEELKDEYPNEISVLSFYAEALREAKRINESVAMYKKILEQEPDDVHAMVSLASMAFLENKTDEAERYVSMAEKTGKMTFGYYGNLAFNLLVAGKDKKAATYYEKAIALHPNGHDYYNLACAYAKYGEKDRAFISLDNAINYGYGSKDLIEKDTDLTSLRNDARFKYILAKLK